MRQASVWYSSQPFSMMSIDRSGVFTWTAPSVVSQNCVTSASTSFSFALR